MQKSIVILIADFDFKKFDNLKNISKFHTKWQIREETLSQYILTDVLEIHIISLKLVEKLFKKDYNKDSKDYLQIHKLIEQYVTYLSIGISNLINVFEPEAIGIGGSFVYYEEIFLEKLKRKILEDKLLFNERKEIIIQTAILDNDSGIIGATL